MGSGDHDLRHRRRVRRRAQRDLHRRVAADEERRCPRPDRDRDQDLQPDGRRRGSRPWPRHASTARSRRACAASGSSESRSTSRTTSTPRRRRRRRCRRSTTGSRAGKVGAVGASELRRRAARRGARDLDARGLPRYEWVQNGFSLLEQGDTETVFPLLREHGIGYTPFSPLAGGWLTGKYRRDERAACRVADDAATRAVRGLHVRPRLRRARGARARRGRARCLDGRARARLGAARCPS